MKNIFCVFATLLFVVSVVSSCIKEEDVVTSPECYIRSFSVADIKSAVTIQNSSGEDTTVYRTIGGSSIYFNIDQVKKTIASVDSLPVWVDLSRVVPTVSSTGYVYYRYDADTLYMPLLSGSDSIDFTSPVEFLVIGTDGMSTKLYDVRINKSTIETDTLLWNRVENTDLQVEGEHKTLYFEGRLYVFAENGGRTTVTSSSLLSEGRSWSVPVETEGVPGGTIDYSSVVVFGDRIYALGTDRHIYVSTSEERGKTWSKVSEDVFVRILGADANYFYAFNGTAILATSNMSDWSENGMNDVDMLPQTNIAMVSGSTRTNSDLQSVVMAGLNGNDSEHAVVWYKISSVDQSSNQKWGYIQITEENEYGCPKLERLNILNYNDMLVAIGGKNLADDESVAYDGIYRSKDNGITWKKMTSKIVLPESVVGKDIITGITTDGNNLWLVRSGGEIWRGWINKASE